MLKCKQAPNPALKASQILSRLCRTLKINFKANQRAPDSALRSPSLICLHEVGTQCL